VRMRPEDGELFGEAALVISQNRYHRGRPDWEGKVSDTKPSLEAESVFAHAGQMA